MAHKEPAKISGMAIYDDSRPLEVHIFCSLPLLQENFELDFLSEFYHTNHEEKLEAAIKKNKDAIIQFNSAGKKCESFIKEVKITLDSEKNDLPPNLYFIQNVDIAITLLFSTPIKPQELTGEWLLFPDKLLDAEKEYGGNPKASNYEIALTFVGPETITFKSSSKKPTFNWRNPNKEEIKDTAREERETLTLRTHTETAAIIFGGLFLLLSLVWVFSPNRKVPKLLLPLLLLVFIFIFFGFDLSETKSVTTYQLPENKLLKPMMHKKLTKIYKTLSIKDKSELYDSLAESTSQSFLNDSYQSLYKSIFVHTDTLKIAENVTVNSIEVLPNNQVKCSWNVEALVQHMNHVHSKNLAYSAIFKLEYNQKSWRILTGSILPDYEVSIK
ncbi:MAG: hypothetical protein NE334_05150 [Lentisphaeraceae bacterium]|nr:hypothetical protein [Lentisphaeraceae bacterium]